MHKKSYITEFIIIFAFEIIQIEHFNYLERYTFKQNNEVSIIDFYYNGKKQFTRSQPQNNSSIELSKLILSLLN